MSAYASSDAPTAAGSNFTTKSVVWSHEDPAGKIGASRTVSTITLDDLRLPPNWYRLRVWTSEEEAVVAARARLLEDRRAELRIRMEPAGKRRFQKIFKIAEPLSSLSITLEGEPGERLGGHARERSAQLRRVRKVLRRAGLRERRVRGASSSVSGQ